VSSVSEADAATFEAARPRMFGVAYRILGAAAEAEDVVQDTWIRWHGTDRRDVRNAAAFLTTASSRLALNVAGSARARHEAAAGGWMPEPIDPSGDPTIGVERDEALELAVRALSDSLSPSERAVYVLREAFDYPYRQIADLLGLSEANARQLLARARTRLSNRRRSHVGGDHRGLLAAFTTAAQSGDLAPLEQLLADEASDALAIAA
jgi:RNA polymerase sigma-70 factor, ECF subfamily